MSDEESQNKGASIGIGLAFLCLSLPMLLDFASKKQDCYASRDTCEKDWNSNDCAPHPDPSCQYVGRAYRWYGSGHYGNSGSASIGTISRGGFGGIGHAFGSVAS